MTNPSLLILDKRVHQQLIVRDVKRLLATKPLTELLRNWK